MEKRQDINRVELQGVVGSVQMREVGDGRYVRFSVATNHAFKLGDGTPVIETTWHKCLAFEDKCGCSLDGIVKGAAVHLHGRLRCYRYVDINNTGRSEVEIVVNTLETL